MDAIERELGSNLRELISVRASVREVRVFGSRARGNAEPDSDMDVLVVLDCLDREIDKYVSECAWEVGFPAGIVIVPITISYSDLVESPLKESAFIRNVLREGVVV